ncbi:ankyrin repeat domain-containing protein [Faustovirus]|nr:hypothetical protein F-LCD7_0299 [Faustovirus]QJX72560.1 ankyrin repeat domain-containing protein [Faustovirus]
MALKLNNARTQLESMEDLGRAYSYAVDPANGYKCIITTTCKGEDYSCCISDNVDMMRKYYLNGIIAGNLIISENILDHVVKNDASQCLLLLTEIGIRPTERSLELAAIYGHIDVMNVITALGIPITRDTADISAQLGHIDVLKHIYAFDNIIPTTYGLTNSISNRHCAVVDFIYKLLRKHGKKSLNASDSRKLLRKHGRRDITPLYPESQIITQSPRSRSNTGSSLSSMSDSLSDYGAPYSLDISGSTDSPSSTPRSFVLSDLADDDINSDYFSSPISSPLMSPMSSPPTSPRSLHNYTPETTRSRSNSVTSDSSKTLKSPRSLRSSKSSLRKSKLKLNVNINARKISLDNLKCDVSSIEAACATGCVHCFDKSIKYNTEFKQKNENSAVLLRNALLIASLKGHLELCKKLVKIGAQLTKPVFIAAAKSGNLKLFVWLHEAGCPWSYEVYDTAMGCGHKSLGKYALENGCGA